MAATGGKLGCCAPGQSCKLPEFAVGKVYCKCSPGWSCVVTLLESQTDDKAFYNCTDGCVCIPNPSEPKGPIVVETEGAYCYCPKGYTCTVTKVSGSGAEAACFECGNGCECQIGGGATASSAKA